MCYRNSSLVLYLCTGCVSLAEEYHTTTACFSSDKCGYFNLECSHGQIIQIKELLYGWKLVKDPLCANISTNCANSKLCCSHNESDTLKNFTKYQAHDIFKRCSGKASCNDVRATSNFLDPSKPDTLSSYVVVRHTCIPRKFVNFISFNFNFLLLLGPSCIYLEAPCSALLYSTNPLLHHPPSPYPKSIPQSIRTKQKVTKMFQKEAKSVQAVFS